MNIDNLKKARERKKLTQKQASELLGLSNNTYRNYEQGNREPNNELLVRIAQLYDCTTDYLLGNTTKDSGSKTPFDDLTDIEMEQQMLTKYFELNSKQRAFFLEKLVEIIQYSMPKKNVEIVEKKAGDIEDELIDMQAIKTDEKLSSGQ